MARRRVSLEETLKSLRTKYGKSIVSTPDHVEKARFSIPTNIRIFDEVTGLGGLPVGKLIELYGAEGCGKSSLAISVLKEAQRLHPDRYVVWADFEDSWTKEYSEALGVLANDHLLVVKPYSAEEGFDALARVIEATKPIVVVVDSVAAAVPQDEMEAKGQGVKRKGLHSVVVTNFIKWLNPVISRCDTMVICINQLRSQINIAPGGHDSSSITTPGGRALKFYSSMRIFLQAGKQIRDDKTKKVVAHVVHMQIVKNKLAPPFAVCDAVLVHGKGFKNMKVSTKVEIKPLDEDEEAALDDAALDGEGSQEF